uniref:PID domain-containing protein n=1 Tax=Latimeria chalumnae TaxID=7897 RepID=H3A0S8_LATCH
MDPLSLNIKKFPSPDDSSMSFKLELVGSLSVHSLTTMPMLPWVVAEVRRLSTWRSRDTAPPSQVCLYVSEAVLCCELSKGSHLPWSLSNCNQVFVHQPQQVHKLIHNSNEPSYFACLIKGSEATNHRNRSTCYVFRATDQTKCADDS